MLMTIKITNCYPGESEHITTKMVEVPQAPMGDREDWAYDHLFPHTGTGRTEGDAGYFVEVIDAPDQPDLKGSEFAWGI